MTTRVMTKEEVYEFCDGARLVRREPGRHGTQNSYVGEIDGEHWMVTIDVHPDEGWQVYSKTEAIKVREVERVVREWVPVDG